MFSSLCLFVAGKIRPWCESQSFWLDWTDREAKKNNNYSESRFLFCEPWIITGMNHVTLRDGLQMWNRWFNLSVLLDTFFKCHILIWEKQNNIIRLLGRYCVFCTNNSCWCYLLWFHSSCHFGFKGLFDQSRCFYSFWSVSLPCSLELFRLSPEDLCQVFHVFLFHSDYYCRCHRQLSCENRSRIIDQEYRDEILQEMIMNRC